MLEGKKDSEPEKFPAQTFKSANRKLVTTNSIILIYFYKVIQF